MAGTFWVPLRLARSWPPPRSIGASDTSPTTRSAPAPLGPPNLWPVMLTRWAPRHRSARSNQAVPWTASVWNTAPGARSATRAATSTTGLTTPVSLLANMTDTRPMSATASSVSARASRSIRPPASVGTTIPPDSCTGSSTAGCSAAAQTATPVPLPAPLPTVPSTARLSASVPPLVNTTPPGSDPTRAATASRASSMALRASRARRWAPEGLPGWSVNHGSIASTTSGRVRVLAAWSRYTCSGGLSTGSRLRATRTGWLGQVSDRAPTGLRQGSDRSPTDG